MLINKILLATDFSLPSEQLVDCVSEFKPFGLNEVVLVHVIDVQAPVLTSMSFQGFDQEMLDKKNQGPASANIVEAAEQEDATLIVMATRGEGLIKELLLGSTAHSVARRSKRPLLLIPSPQA